MLSTASALLNATEEGIIGESQMLMASYIVHNRNDFSQDEMAKAMFMYATEIASAVTDKVTKVLLTETQFRELIESITEIETMRDEVLNNGE
jgi:hypothetical protein